MLAQHGEERTAEVGEKLFEIGDATYPFIAILEGEAAVTDAAGHEIVRHGASGFLGEMNLLSGQTVFLTAVVTEPMRYIAVDREVLRAAAVRGQRALRPAAHRLRRSAASCCSSGRGSGSRSSARATRRRPAACSSSPAACAPPTPGATRRRSLEAAALLRAARRRRRCRWCGCPAAPSCGGRATASSRARSGSASSSARARRSTC